MSSYCITVDDLDHALLPLRSRTQNDFLKKEYFNFSVTKEERDLETSDITYTCHICAIDVPAKFASEHAASIKHRANATIANVAMQRARKNISQPPLFAKKSSARFCANCATIADDDHDKTKEHRVAVMNDNRLWELMKSYVGDDDEANDHNGNAKKSEDQSTSRVEEKKNDIAFKNGVNHNENCAAAAPLINKTEVTELKENKTGNNGIVKGQQNAKNCEINDKNQVEPKDEAVKKGAVKKTIDSISSTNKNKINQSTNHVAITTSRCVKHPPNKDIVGKRTNQNGVIKEINKHTNIAESHYGEELRKFVDAKNSFQLRILYGKILVQINNDTMYTYSDNFHSFHRKFNNEIKCIVCDYIFNKGEEEIHKYDSNHMSRIAKINDDGHGVRKVDKAYSHCIMCNQKIRNRNVATHKQTKHHIGKEYIFIRSSDKTEGNDNKNGGIANKNGGIANKNGGIANQNGSIANKNGGIANQNGGIANKNGGIANQNGGIANKNGNNGNETHTKIKRTYVGASGELRCVTCNGRVPRNLRNRKDHVNNLKLK